MILIRERRQTFRDTDFKVPNSTIVCGLIIGEYALIGSGAVVTKDVPPHALIIGNPGKIVGWVDEKGNRLIFNGNGLSDCRKFRLDGEILEKI